MLDQMSGGRLEIGFGRGTSPIELAYYGVDPEERQEIYAEALDVIARAHAQDARFRRQVFTSTTCRWSSSRCKSRIRRCGTGCMRPKAPSARRSATSTSSVSIRPPNAAVHRALSRDLAAAAPGADVPSSGSAASSWSPKRTRRRCARAPRLSPLASELHAFSAAAGRAQTHPRPPEWDALVAVGQGIAGSPETVTAFLQASLPRPRCNYVVGQFAFGDMTRDECLRSIELFADEVMPALRRRMALTFPSPL